MSAAIAPHILVVDDDPKFSRTLCRLLAENGYHAASLGSSVALDEYLATRPVDLLMLDLSLPGASGRAILEAIRNDAEHADLPVLALTSATPEEASVEALGLGASDVIPKPV